MCMLHYCSCKQGMFPQQNEKEIGQTSFFSLFPFMLIVLNRNGALFIF